MFHFQIFKTFENVGMEFSINLNKTNFKKKQLKKIKK